MLNFFLNQNISVKSLATPLVKKPKPKKSSQKLGLTASFNYILQKVDLEHYNSDNQLYHTESLTIDLMAFKVGLILY